jgi:ATP-dependent metalloprotease
LFSGGHALMLLYTEGASALHKVTIMPRGSALGLTHFFPSDEFSRTRQQYLAELDVAMGGRVAEELIFGEANITSGAYGDFKSATQIATQMVMMYGMGNNESTGFVAYEPDNYTHASEHTKQLIDSEIKKLTFDAYSRTQKLLTEHKRELHLLADALLKYETLDQQEVKDIINGIPLTRQI